MIGVLFLILWIAHLSLAWLRISQFWEAHHRQLVVRMDGISREIASVGNIQPHHFRELVRSRHKSPEAIQVLKFAVPFSLHRDSLKSTWIDSTSREDNSLGITFKFDSTWPGFIQAYWGVTIDSSAPGPEPWTLRAVKFKNEIVFEQNPQNNIQNYLSVFADLATESSGTPSLAQPVASLLRTNSFLKASTPFPFPVGQNLSFSLGQRNLSFPLGQNLIFSLDDGFDALDPHLSLNYSRVPSAPSIPLVIAVSFSPPVNDLCGGGDHVCCQLLCLEFEIADGLDLAPSTDSTNIRNPAPRANLLKLITVTSSNVYDVQVFAMEIIKCDL